MILLLSPLASATDIDFLAEVTSANDLVDRCERRGPSCGASADELADALVTSAIGAGVLYGELDLQSVANARFLAPDSVDRWQDVLPASDLVPEPWVSAWAGEDPDDLPPLEPAARAGWVRGPGPSEVRLATGASLLFSDQIQVELATLQAAGRVGWWIAGDFAHGTSGLTDRPRGWAIRTGGLELGVGPRWQGPGGRDLLVWGGVGVRSGAIAAGWERLAAVDLATPAWVATGPRVGWMGTLPFADGSFAVRFSNTAGIERVWTLPTPLAPGRDGARSVPPRVEFGMDGVVALEWRVAPDQALTLGLASRDRPVPEGDDLVVLLTAGYTRRW